jgi:hypothetical protein
MRTFAFRALGTAAFVAITFSAGARQSDYMQIVEARSFNPESRPLTDDVKAKERQAAQRTAEVFGKDQKPTSFIWDAYTGDDGSTTSQ